MILRKLIGHKFTFCAGVGSGRYGVGQGGQRMHPELVFLPEIKSGVRSMLKFYGYKKCSTCRKAENALVKLGRDYLFIDITENPPSQNALKKMVGQSGAELKKFFNTSGLQYKELNIKDKVKTLSQTDILSLLASNGRLLKRPIVTDGVHTTVGFDETQFQKAWK